MINRRTDFKIVPDGNIKMLGTKSVCPTYLALSAHQHDPHVRAYFEHLVVTNGKVKMQALCAVMRKLLHAIHGMLKHDKPFDNTRFYAIPASAE